MKRKRFINISNNKVFNQWNELIQSYHLILITFSTKYLEDLNLVKFLSIFY